MPRLTKKSVDALPIKDKEYFVWDDQLKGFGVRVYPNGGKRYVAQTFRNGKTTRVQIGRHGALPFDEARKRAGKIISDIDDGINPNDDKRSERNAPTVEQVAKRFMEEYLPSHCKSHTQVDYARSVNTYIVPAIGEIKAAKLTRSDVSDLHHTMRATPYQANRTLAVLSKMMNLAEAWGYRPDRSNPCYHVKKFKEQKRERFLTPEELICLRKSLEKEDATSRPATTAFRLLLFTGARLSEIQTLKWSYIQGDRVFLPDSKTGAKILHLGQTALDVLLAVERVEGNPYVITGTQEGAFMNDLRKPWRRVRNRATVFFWRDYSEAPVRELIRSIESQRGSLPPLDICCDSADREKLTLPPGLTDVRIHDLRHTFASSAVMTGESLPMIGKLLGHTQPQTTARYAHLADAPLRDAVRRIDAMLGDSMTERSPTNLSTMKQ